MAAPGVIVRIDEADSTTTYVGYTTVGLRDSTDLEIWLIKQILIEDGSETVTSWASEDYDQVWADRATLTYT